MTKPEIADIERKALARNLRYLTEVVEAHTFCPFARLCRESGKLERRVLLMESPDITAMSSVIADVHRPEFAHIEIGLLIFPLLQITPQDFERATSKLRDATKAAGHGRFFIVAFHPDAPFDASVPESMVPLLRRSPDPTLQLVRVAVLDSVRGEDVGTVYANPKTLDIRNPPPPQPPGLSERIGVANYETVRRMGAEKVAALLDAIRRDR